MTVRSVEIGLVGVLHAKIKVNMNANLVIVTRNLGVKLKIWSGEVL